MVDVRSVALNLFRLRPWGQPPPCHRASQHLQRSWPSPTIRWATSPSCGTMPSSPAATSATPSRRGRRRKPSPTTCRLTTSTGTHIVYDHAGVRKITPASRPAVYPNQYDTDFGGGAGSPFKHIFLGFLGQQHILKKEGAGRAGAPVLPTSARLR